MQIVSVCPTPVDDTTTDIFATYWVSEDLDYDDRLAAAKQSLPADIAIWSHQLYLDHPGLAPSESDDFVRLRDWARRFYPPARARPAQRDPVGVLLGQEVADRQLDRPAARFGVQPVHPQHRMAGHASHGVGDHRVRRCDRDRLRGFGNRVDEAWFEQPDDRVGATWPHRPVRPSAAPTGPTAGGQVHCRRHERHAIVAAPERHRVHDVVGEPQPARDVDVHPSTQTGHTSMVVSSDRLIRSSMEPS